MAEWKEVPASEVKPGDRVRTRGVEITATRVEDSFLKRENFLAFIEDTPERWLKVPSPSDAVVEVYVD